MTNSDRPRFFLMPSGILIKNVAVAMFHTTGLLFIGGELAAGGGGPALGLCGERHFVADLGEDFESGVRFCKFVLRTKAGESRWGCQVRLLRAGRGILPEPWVPDSPNVMGKCP